MAKHYKDIEELGACQICDHCSYNRCLVGNENFGNISYPEECEDFDFAQIQGVDGVDEDDVDRTKPIDCPECGGDAYWEGGYYECDQCGWCGILDDDDDDDDDDDEYYE